MTERTRHVVPVFPGAHPSRGRGQKARASRVALVLALCTLSTPALAQWFDEPEPVKATDEAQAVSPPAPLPAPQSTPPEAPAPASAAPAAPAPSEGATAPAQLPAPAATAPPGPAAAGAPAEGTPAATSEPLRFRVAIGTEVAFGSDNRFRNYLFGPRLDLRFSDQTAAGYSVRYANLPGREDRVHNALHTVTLEHRLLPSEGTGFAVPVRMSGGYLPNNGPFLQVAGGAGYVGERVEVLLLPVMPTFWNTGNKTWFALDVALEIGIRL